MSSDDSLVLLLSAHLSLILRYRPLVVSKDIYLPHLPKVDHIKRHINEESLLQRHLLMVNHFVVFRLREG